MTRAVTGLVPTSLPRPALRLAENTSSIMLTLVKIETALSTRIRPSI